jgi:RNA polymerase sigma-70 factor, ECF subfamily
MENGHGALLVMSRIDSLARLADEDLMPLIGKGSARAFELLYDRHGTHAFSLAYRIVGDRSSAEEVAQDAFLSIWRSRERYQAERGSVRAWVLAIVRNRAVDALRRNVVEMRRRAATELPAADRPASELTDVDALRREEARRVRGALAELPEDQSKVIKLAYFGGFTHSEIADLLEMPIGTVKGRMRLGLEKMRRQLAGEAA